MGQGTYLEDLPGYQKFSANDSHLDMSVVAALIKVFIAHTVQHLVMS